jgi:hypothetical protein
MSYCRFHSWLGTGQCPDCTSRLAQHELAMAHDFPRPPCPTCSALHVSLERVEAEREEWRKSSDFWWAADAAHDAELKAYREGIEALIAEMKSHIAAQIANLSSPSRGTSIARVMMWRDRLSALIRSKDGEQ